VKITKNTSKFQSCPNDVVIQKSHKHCTIGCSKNQIRLDKIIKVFFSRLNSNHLGACVLHGDFSIDCSICHLLIVRLYFRDLADFFNWITTFHFSRSIKYSDGVFVVVKKSSLNLSFIPFRKELLRSKL
jgi:hypothetical protein